MFRKKSSKDAHYWHDGSLSTGHANNIEGMLKRLEAMFLQAADLPVEAIRSQITEGIDIMIHMSRMPDGSRRVMEISEIEGMQDGDIRMNSLYKYGCGRANIHLKHTEKLELSGYSTDMIMGER